MVAPYDARDHARNPGLCPVFTPADLPTPEPDDDEENDDG